MSVSWGYSPKSEKFIPLGNFPADKYLIVAQQAIENLGWELSHISKTGLIAYTPISLQSYSEEISIRIHGGFAVVKSECVGIQMLFNDYGKNELNFEKFFHEFEYVEFHLQGIWDERLDRFHRLIAEQDDTYFEKAPLAVKNKIKNILYLFFPQKGYKATPLLVLINVTYFFLIWLVTVLYFRYILTNQVHADADIFVQKAKNFSLNLSVNHRNAVLDGAYWRLITYQFVHGSISHIFFNMYAFIYLGLMIENKLGWKKFLFIYIFSGVCGGSMSLIFHQETIMMGASGAIMGLYGAFIALLLNKTFEPKATRALLISTLIVSALILINGAFGKKVDNAAHIGGFLCGFILCCTLVFNFRNKVEIRHWVRYSVSTLLVLLFFGSIVGFSSKYQTEKFNELSKEFNSNLEYLKTITRLEIDLPKDIKLISIKEDGIKPTEKNLKIIKQMQGLNLNSENAKDRDRKIRLGKASYQAVMLMYRDIKGDSTFKYSKQTSNALGKMFTILYE